MHSNGSVIYQNGTSNVENMQFSGQSTIINAQQGTNTFSITSIDSITFGKQELPPPGDVVDIVYVGNTVEVTNPFASQGVNVNANGADVMVNSIINREVFYRLSGASSNGSFAINSDKGIVLQLYSLSLSSNDFAAINITNAESCLVYLNGTSTLSDGANGSQKGAFTSACYTNFNQQGETTGVLKVSGRAKHGINIEGNLNVNSGRIEILEADSDGIHCNSLTQSFSEIVINNCGSDGIDCSENINMQGNLLEIYSNAIDVKGLKAGGEITLGLGSITINSTGEEFKAIKADSTISIHDVTINMQLSGQGVNGISSNTDVIIGNGSQVYITSSSDNGKCINSNGTVNISGGIIDLNHSGNISKGIKCDGEIIINGGDITIESSGSTILENENGQNVPSYCTAIKSDNDITITNGTFHITLPTSNHGGKSISADGNLSISGGDFTIETHGDGAAYTVSGNTKDSYTSSCLKCDGNMEILTGTFNLTSTGKGGKGINSGGTLVIGQEGANNNELTLNVTTSGERITITSGGGGPWGGGDYANPKAIKAEGDLTINSGNINVLCSQTQNEGGECIESKAYLTINGGNIEAYSKKDDAVNATRNITINGGTYYVHSDGNDGTDSNGTMFLQGGFLISSGSRQPEEGFDCDNNQFKVTEGVTFVGTGGGTSNPTQNVCTQPTLKINTQAGYAIQVLSSSGDEIVTFQCPEFTGGGGGGWPGGGGNSMVMLFSDPKLQTGSSYTVKYGGTISGGTNTNGYYTGNVTYSGGQQTTVNVNSMLTTVSAGGGGW